MHSKDLGELGEKIACEYLVEKGFNILGKNWRISFGEIDIIAKKKQIIHFVEVKAIAMGSGGFYPEDHVNYKKQRKLRQMAQIWLEKEKYKENVAYQIDIIGILIDETTRNARLHYFSNAVQAS